MLFSGRGRRTWSRLPARSALLLRRGLHRRPAPLDTLRAPRILKIICSIKKKTVICWWLFLFGRGRRTWLAPPLRRLGRSRSQQSTGLLLCTARPSNPFLTFCKQKRTDTARVSVPFSWRRARDSNPRTGYSPLHDFQSCSFDQLGQLSVSANQMLIYYIWRFWKNQVFF